MTPHWLDPVLSDKLCLTLLHSAWLVIAIALLAWIIERMWASRSVERTYAVYATALVLSAAILPITWYCVDVETDAATGVTSADESVEADASALVSANVANSAPEQFPESQPVSPSIAVSPLSTGRSSSSDKTAPADTVVALPEQTNSASSASLWRAMTPYLAAIYFVGVAVMLLRLGFSTIRSSRRLTVATSVDVGPLVSLLNRLAKDWSLKVAPVLLQSKDAVVPQVIGFLKPVILLPVSAVNNLSTEQLELILIHELAHIRRHDMWIHLLQRVMESVLFFNPALWWLSYRISTVREYCCDDLACRAAGGTQPQIQYATVLLRIAELSVSARPELTSLAASGASPSELRRRVARVLGEPLAEPFRVSRTGIVASLAVALFLLAVPLWQATASPVDEPEPVLQAAANEDHSSDSVEKLFRLFVVGPDGNPVANAEVEFRGSPKVSENQIRRGTFEKRARYGTLARTDWDGRITVSLSDAQRGLRVSVEKPGFGPYWVDWSSHEHPEAIPDRFTARLDGAWSIGSVLVDENGKPVEGVRVRPSVYFKKPPSHKSKMGIGTTLKTDVNGRWKFDMVPDPEDDVWVSFDHPDFGPLRQSLKRSAFEVQPDEVSTTKIELPVGLSIAGTVTDEAGKPVEGALIKTQFVNELRQGRTDENGLYRIRGCEPMMTRIVIAAKGYATDMQEHRIDPDMKPVNFQLKPGGHIKIRVVDENGKGLKRACIFYQDWRGRHSDDFEFDHIDQYTDDDGVWEWNEAPLDEFTADICRPGGMALLGQSLVAREQEYVFSPPKRLVVSGTVVDAKTKKAIPNFQVVPGTRNEPHRGTKDWWSRDEGYTATDGKYNISRDRAAPTHMIRIEAEGYRVARSRDILSTEGKIDVNFELQPAENISVQMLTPEGKPAVGARVAFGIKEAQIFVEHGLISDRQTYAKEATTNQEGIFAMPPIDEAFQIVVTHSDGFAVLKSKDGPLPKSARLTPFARVEGVFMIGANPARDIRLSVASTMIDSHSNDGPSIFTGNTVTTDKDGRFVFERVIPGQASIGRELNSLVRQGYRSAYSSKRTPIEFPAGETTTLNLGGDGRAVVGQLLPPASDKDTVRWNFASVDVETDLPEPEWPEPPAELQEDPQAASKWWDEWGKTDEGKKWIAISEKLQKQKAKLPRFHASIDREGRFRIDDVPPGKYVLDARFHQDAPGNLTTVRFTVPKLAAGDIGRELVLKNLTLEPFARPE